MSLIGVDLCRSRDGTINHEQLVQHGRASLTPALFHQDNRVPGRFRAPAHPPHCPGVRCHPPRCLTWLVAATAPVEKESSRPEGTSPACKCFQTHRPARKQPQCHLPATSWSQTRHLLSPTLHQYVEAFASTLFHSQGSEQETLQIYQTLPLHSCSSYLQLVRFSSPD